MKKIGLSLYWFLNIAVVMTMLSIVIVCGTSYNRLFKLFRIDVETLFCDNKATLLIILSCLAVLVLFSILCVRSSQKGLQLCWKIRIWKWEKQIFFQAHKVSYPILVISVIWLIMCGCLYVFLEDESITSDWNRDITIGHSFGGIDGNVYTGSLEAFEENYKLGHRTFEVDLMVTSDKELVLCHDWERFNFSSELPPTETEFMSSVLMEKYTPMSFADLCMLMNEYDDMWIVLDTKDRDMGLAREKFQILYDTVQQNNVPHIMDRIIVQLYNEDMYEIVNDKYPFKQYIFTLYLRWESDMDDFIQICRWSIKNSVDVITMPHDLVNEEVLEIIDRYDLDLYVHTVNDVEEAQKYLDKGVKGIYTDFIIPSQLEGE